MIVAFVKCRFGFGEPGAVRPRISSAKRPEPDGTRLTKLGQLLIRLSLSFNRVGSAPRVEC